MWDTLLDGKSSAASAEMSLNWGASIRTVTVWTDWRHNTGNLHLWTVATEVLILLCKQSLTRYFSNYGSRWTEAHFYKLDKDVAFTLKTNMRQVVLFFLRRASNYSDAFPPFVFMCLFQKMMRKRWKYWKPCFWNLRLLPLFKDTRLHW